MVENRFCEDCGAPVYTKMVDDPVIFTVADKSVEIECQTPFCVCDSCGVSWLDSKGVAIREKAVSDYLDDPNRNCFIF